MCCTSLKICQILDLCKVSLTYNSIFVTHFRTVEPMEYYRRFLKENCRPDGRELGEFRTTTVNIGSISTADGSALVKLGNTTVVCGVKAEFAAPPTDAPDKGYVGKFSDFIILI
uniref:exosome complex component RRP43 isoform X1 n=1 Tax=Ictidomys tridecemlineatus TaxID=43179 RepID=UPI000B5474F2|nr:exosome complex component RRP43 isoform X1 [Ictidomys tridecemlineatus]